MKVDAYLSPNFTEKELQFENSIVLMIDVLRASSTVCAAVHSGAKEVITVDSVDKAVALYSNLSREIRFLGGERNGVKLQGFDAGNSPTEYTADRIAGKSVVISTTNGTQIFQKCKSARQKIVLGFINIDAIIAHLVKENTKEAFHRIDVICAGNEGRISFEDTLCAGAVIDRISSSFGICEMSDSALVAKNVYDTHKDNLLIFIKTRDHSKHLMEIGMGDDIDICLTNNIYPVVPIINGNSIKAENQ